IGTGFESAAFGHPEDLCHAEIDLVQPVAILRSRIDHANGRLTCVEEIGTSETLNTTGGDVGGGVENIREDERPLGALERPANSDVPRQDVRAQRLVGCDPAAVLVAVALWYPDVLRGGCKRKDTDALRVEESQRWEQGFRHLLHDFAIVG